MPTAARHPLLLPRHPLLLLLLLLGLASPAHALLAVRPVSFGRLALPIYGAEHLLILRLTEETGEAGLRLPLVCSYDQGSRLEAALTRPAERPIGLALSADVLQRKAFFEAASGQQLSLWDCGGLPAALKTSTLPETMIAHLQAWGLSPVQLELGGMSSISAVGMRDMGANTPAAPSSVRPDDLPAALVCRRDDDPSGAIGALPLESAAEAVLLARAAKVDLPLLVAEALWEQRAVAPSRLPEFMDTLWSSEGAPE
jgi:hypothetical protein